ncbi:Uu.00g057080.m01.CDS01 [Anthostomella pinea]|uniref:Uu.00g057080.m01.CDS01 n=1 Tax=Anthostomella pinea TaxID=933095 RepID=A0AAI8VSH6_9PEZI|nr:Uu.00g057080.m01.CDS01 [Anthostomella pinea]
MDPAHNNTHRPLGRIGQIVRAISFVDLVTCSGDRWTFEFASCLLPAQVLAPAHVPSSTILDMPPDMVTVRRIASVHPIRGSSSHDVVMVDGWSVVAKKHEEYKAGDLVVFFEIDSFLPDATYFWEYVATSRLKMNGKEGFLIKTTEPLGA